MAEQAILEVVIPDLEIRFAFTFYLNDKNANSKDPPARVFDDDDDDEDDDYDDEASVHKDAMQLFTHLPGEIYGHYRSAEALWVSFVSPLAAAAAIKKIPAAEYDV